MIQIVLINPRNNFVSFKRFEVLGLGYLGAYLKSQGYQVQIYDCNFSDDRADAVASYCKVIGTDVVGFTAITGSLVNALAMASAVKKACSEITVLLGGYSATFEYEDILKSSQAIDFLLRGEGELSLRILLSQLEVHGSGIRPNLEEVPGLVYRTRHGIHIVPGPYLVRNLDDLPFPLRSNYLDRIGLASILSSRGCQGRCSFCSIQEFYRVGSGNIMRCRSVRNVVEEIETIHRATGITRFLFIDDNFFGTERISHGRLSALASELLARGLSDIRLEVSARSCDLKLPELKMLAEAGLDTVYLGLESGSQAQLNRYRKGCSVKKNEWAVREVRAHGLRLDFGLIPFDPYLTPEDLLLTMEFLDKENLITIHTLNTLTVTVNLFPGTLLYRQARADGLVHKTVDFNHWFDFADGQHQVTYLAIIDYFKTKYIINAVDQYSNGYYQQNFTGPSPEEISRFLRILFKLWKERVYLIFDSEPTEEIDARINCYEGFLQNVLGAYLILNRIGQQPTSLFSSRYFNDGLLILEKVTAELTERLREVVRLESPRSIPGFWVKMFRIDRLYRGLRRGEEMSWINEGTVPDESTLCKTTKLLFDASRFSTEILSFQPLVGSSGPNSIFDVFVPPTADLPANGGSCCPGTPPSTLYLGSVTGMPPICLELLDRVGRLHFSFYVHKGWNEVRIPAKISSHPAIMIWARSSVPLYEPVIVQMG